MTNRKSIDDSKDDSIPEAKNNGKIGKILTIGGKVHKQRHGDSCEKAGQSW